MNTNWRVHEHDDGGWYFEGNDAECYGPYFSREEAITASQNYRRYFEGICGECEETGG